MSMTGILITNDHRRSWKGVVLRRSFYLSVSQDSYFNTISNVEQMVFLFEHILRNNITLFKDYSDEQINKAVEKA